jgi:hypothetical protein
VQASWLRLGSPLQRNGGVEAVFVLLQNSF